MYIDVQIPEGSLLNGIGDILVAGGWELERYFKKTVVAGESVKPPIINIVSGGERYGVAEHLIVKHPDDRNNIYYGMAMYGEVNLPFALTPKEFWPISYVTETPMQGYDNIDKIAIDVARRQALTDYLTNMYPKFKQKHTIYFYMLDAMSDDIPNNGDVFISVPNKDLKAGALDVEVVDTAFIGNGPQSVYQVLEAYPHFNQSPISAASIRVPSVDSSDLSTSFVNPIVKSNWHHDSLVDVEGVVNEDFCFLMLLADTSASYENNAVPKIPLFMGRFDPEDPEDQWNHAIATGSAFKSFPISNEFNFDDPNVKVETIQPILKDYKSNPSNGIDSVMVYRGKKGAYYQRHTLMIDAPSNLMPPKREYNGKGYPRAWQRSEAEAYSYQHNPSRYTGNVPATEALIRHPEEGVRGKFPLSILVNPISLIDGNELKVRVAFCENGYDVYKYHLVEGISVFTKIPGVPYRQMGIGLLKEKYEELADVEGDGN